MEKVINDFLILLEGTERFIRSSPERFCSDLLADFLHEFRVQRVHPLHKRARLLGSDRFVLSLAGLTNVGKSTLTHALFKHPIAPRRNSPATAVPVEYEYSDKWRMTTHNSRDKTVSDTYFDSSEELGAVLERRVFDLPADSAAKIGKVLVRGPIEVLRDGMLFADTPGFGAAHLNDDGANHNAALAAYLSTHVHEVMFCVSGSNCMIRNEELEFFNSIRHLCTTVIVTKWDDDSEGKGATEYRSRFAGHFPLCGFCFVEAKLAATGQAKESGIESIVQLLEQRATKLSRAKTFDDQIVRAWNDLLELSQEPMRQARLHAVPWHKAALPEFLAAAGRHNLHLVNPIQ
jgi:GTP-binding protein EngB required for normal cell division